MMALLMEAAHASSGVSTPSRGKSPTMAQPVMAMGMTSVTQNTMATRNTTSAVSADDVRPASAGAR